MKFQTLSTFCLATVAIAAPTTMAPRGGLTYDASNPPEIFTDASCKLTKSLTPGEPLSFNYPLASSLGSIVSPVLDAALGKQTVEDLDSVADQLCVYVFSTFPRHSALQVTDTINQQRPGKD